MAGSLKSFWESVLFQPLVKTSAAGNLLVFFVLVTTACNVVDAQEVKNGFAATEAFSTVVINDLLFQLVTNGEPAAIVMGFVFLVPLFAVLSNFFFGSGHGRSLIEPPQL